MPHTTSTPFDIPDDLIVALQQAKHVMVFSGAGVSAESGIPTFRDALTGMWARFALPPGIPDVPEGGSHIEPPCCLHCGGPVRPGVVWFGESLVVADIHRAWDAAEDCDLLLVIGTSGLVQPAAGIPAMAKKAGAMVALVNPQSTPLDNECHWALQGPAGEVMPALLAAAFAEDRWPG